MRSERAEMDLRTGRLCRAAASVVMTRLSLFGCQCATAKGAIFANRTLNNRVFQRHGCCCDVLVNAYSCRAGGTDWSYSYDGTVEMVIVPP